MLKNGSFKGELNLWVQKNWGAAILLHACIPQGQRQRPQYRSSDK